MSLECCIFVESCVIHVTIFRAFNYRIVYNRYAANVYTYYC